MDRPGQGELLRTTRVRRLEERVRRLEAVVRAGALANQILDLQVLSEQVVALSVEVIGAERGSLFLVDEEEGTLTSIVAQGIAAGGLTLRKGEGIVGTVAETGEAMILKDPYSDPRFDRSFDEATGFRTRSLLTVPVRNREGSLVAVLQLLNRTGGCFTPADVEFLAEMGVPFAIALSMARQHLIVLERERIREELRLAAEIQGTLRPSPSTRVPKLELSILCKPSREVGGDYYDLIPGKDGTWWIVIADVSGKGVSSALIASNIQAFLWSRRDERCSLESVAADGSDLLHHLARGKKYATLVLLHWDPASGRVRCVNAGHPPPLMLRGSRIYRLSATGIPLGLIPGTSYRARSFRLLPGDLALLYTDGVSEAGEEMACGAFGDARVEACLKPGPAEGVAERLRAALAGHLAGGEPSDDMTVLCARCIGDGAPKDVDGQA